MAIFGERLRILRRGRSLSQQALADAVGVSKSSIAMYEQGRREPDFEMQEALADFFNVDIDYLVGRSDETTAVFATINGNPDRRYLMDKIAKADDEKIRKLKMMMELINGDDSAG